MFCFKKDLQKVVFTYYRKQTTSYMCLTKLEVWDLQWEINYFLHWGNGCKKGESR